MILNNAKREMPNEVVVGVSAKFINVLRRIVNL